MTGNYKLQTLESSDANQQAWAYKYFDLATRVKPPAPSNQYDLFAAAPQGSFSPGSTISWVSRGIRLPPRLTQAQNEGIVEVFSVYDDWTTLPVVQNSAVAQVQLHPNVRLVPLHVIQLHLKPGGSVGQDGWYSKDRAEVTLDDDWSAATYIEDATPFFPFQVTTQWLDRPNSSPPLQGEQPDLVWTQCDIQFRLVSYTACEVPDDVFNNRFPSQSGFECNSIGQEAKVASAVKACAAAQGKPGFPVILTNTLENPLAGCGTETAGVTDPNINLIMTQKGIAARGVLSHELGHVMGLKGHSLDPNNVMHATHVSGSPLLLTSTQCSAARAGALGLQNSTTWPAP